jgi:hypothetical protein
MISRVILPGAPVGLEVAVAQGDAGAGRGASPRTLDRLIETLLPGRAVVRLAGGGPVVRGADDVHLSLSHAAGATVLAVAPFPIGVDIECVDADVDPLAIEPELFGLRDFAFLQAQSQAVRHSQFYRLWTLKEAWLKRRGRTLADSALPDILADVDIAAPAALEGRLGADMATGWLDRAGKRYCVGVCWAAAAPSPVLASANC